MVALAKRTWPLPKMKAGRRVNVYLPAEAVEQLKALGKGNISEGIRQALKRSRRRGEPKDPFD